MAVEYVWKRGRYQAVGETEVARQLRVEVVDELPETGSPGVIYIVPSSEEPSSEAKWGSITGTLSNQTDLQTALNNKVNNSRLDQYVYNNNKIISLPHGIILGQNPTEKTNNLVIHYNPDYGNYGYYFTGFENITFQRWSGASMLASDGVNTITFSIYNDDYDLEYSVTLDDSSQQPIFDEWIANETVLYGEYFGYLPPQSGGIKAYGTIEAGKLVINNASSGIDFKTSWPTHFYSEASGYSYKTNLYIARTTKPFSSNNIPSFEVYPHKNEGLLTLKNGGIELPSYSANFSSGIFIGNRLIGYPKNQGGYFGICDMSVNSNSNQYDFVRYRLKIGGDASDAELTSDIRLKIGTLSTPAYSGYFNTIYTGSISYINNGSTNNALNLGTTNLTTYLNIIPNTTNSINVGSDTKKFNTVYTTNISDGTNTASVASIINSSGGGTTVVANPTLSGNESALTGLQVGQQKYKINNNIFSTDIDWSDGDEWDLEDETYYDIWEAIYTNKVIKFNDGIITKHYYPTHYFEDSHTEEIDTGEIDEETGEPIYEEIEIYEYHHQYSYTYFDSLSNKQKFEIVTFTTNDQDSLCTISVSQKQL